MDLICPTCKALYKLKREKTIECKQRVKCFNCKQTWVHFEEVERYLNEHFSQNLIFNKDNQITKKVISKNKELEQLIFDELEINKKSKEKLSNIKSDKYLYAGFISASVLFIFTILIYKNEQTIKEILPKNFTVFDQFINILNFLKNELEYILTK